MEKIVNRRLILELEERSLLSDAQYGFRNSRSTTNLLQLINEQINDAFTKKLHVLAIFFDLQKAFDIAIRYKILQTIHSWGFKGHLIQFIKNFLSNRSFHVC